MVEVFHLLDLQCITACRLLLLLVLRFHWVGHCHLSLEVKQIPSNRNISPKEHLPGVNSMMLAQRTSAGARLCKAYEESFQSSQDMQTDDYKAWSVWPVEDVLMLIFSRPQEQICSYDHS
jgi:hypothetical protein